jgi:hypothetical protein
MPRSRSLRDQRLELGPAGSEDGEFGPCLVERGVGPGLVCGWSAVGRRAAFPGWLPWALTFSLPTLEGGFGGAEA